MPGSSTRAGTDNQYKGIVQDSVVVFAVRKGNPKNIQTWDDVVESGVEVVTPNVFSSGGAKWNLMAAYGAQLNQGKSPEEALEFLRSVLEHAVVQPGSAADALTAFTSGKGDVLLSYESEAIKAQDAGEEVDYVVPDDTILIETPAATTTDASTQAAGLPHLPVDARGAAAVGGRRLPPGGQVGAGRERGQVPGAAWPVRHRQPRRLGEGERRVLRSRDRQRRRDPERPGGLHRVTPVAPGARAEAPPRPASHGRVSGAPRLGVVSSSAYLSLIVLIPIAALVAQSTEGGLDAFWTSVTSPLAVSALKLTLIASAIVVVINVIAGTAIAWVLVRDSFPGKRIVNSVIDLPFALPTVVAGITLLALYGTDSPLGVNIAFTRVGVVTALLFVTLPFVVRAVQPVLLELDREMEEAAASLGAGPLTTFRRVILPNLTPAILSGAALAFARAIGEFGSLVLLSGNLPKTQVSSLFIFAQIESGNTTGAAAVSVTLLVIALVVLLLIGRLTHWSLRHAR